MPTQVIMPKFGMAQEDATVVSWLFQDGDAVEKGDPILEVETDKTTMEVESPASGILDGIRVRVGEVVPVTEVIAFILAPGESLPKDWPPARGEEIAQEDLKATPLAKRMADQEGVDIQQISSKYDSTRVTRREVERFLAEEQEPRDSLSENEKNSRATPAARRLAREHKIELALVRGSGPRGRIQEADIRAALRADDASERIPRDTGIYAAGQVIPLAGIRRTIAERMQHSYQTAPHITFTVEADMTAALATLESLNAPAKEADEARISVSALLLQATAWTINRHPWVNASLVGEEIHLHRDINVGVAVALSDGLIVPVVKNASSLGLAEIAVGMNELVAKAKVNKLMPDDVSGGTFTISNLGMYGVKHFTAIINPPQSAILAVGKIQKTVLVKEGKAGDEMVVRPVMTMTLSVDHRVLDGVQAAKFLQDLVSAMEEPSLMLY